MRALRDAYEDAIAQAEREDRENHYNPYKDPAHELYRGDPPARADSPAGAHEIVLYDSDEEADDAGLLFNGPIAFHPPQAPAEPPAEPPKAPRPPAGVVAEGRVGLTALMLEAVRAMPGEERRMRPQREPLRRERAACPARLTPED